MPIYEYECLNCKHEFEHIQGVNDTPLKKCPQCGKNKAQKRVSKGAFQLKGGGWYADGYSKEKSTKASTAKETNTQPAPSAPASSSNNTKS